MPVPFRLLILPGAAATVGEGSSADDTSGSAIWAVLEKSEHPLLPEQRCAADDLPHALLEACGLRAVTVVCGGPTVPASAVLRMARDGMDEELPGFAEAVRRIWSEERGVEAVLADAAAGPAGEGMIVALPGPMSIAAAAIEQILLPLLDQLLPAPAPRQTALPSAPTPAADPAEVGSQTGRIDLVEIGGSTTPQADPGPAKVGWQGALAALGGSFDRDRWGGLPELFDRVAPARNVLETAGERATCTLADGRVYAAFGFPDLLRSRSKVLLVGAGDPMGEVVALHRHPVKVGVVMQGDEGLLPTADSDLDSIATARTGSHPAGFGTLFAVDGGVVYYLRERRVLSWDGSNERDEGTPNQALASLLLRWSQR